MNTAIFAAAAALLSAAPALAQAPQSVSGQNPATTSVSTSGLIPGPHGFVRCATPDTFTPNNPGFAPPSDCSSNNTNPDVAYSPANLEALEIPVVFHVIRTSNGTGNVPNARVLSQVEILNEDFRALSGTPGAQGTDVKIQFALATEDPSGQPTTGIVRYDNSTWYNDNGSYWNSIAWDPDVYLNIYTLGSPGGNSNVLGYVPFLPASSPNSVGSNADRVVVLNSTVGRNGPAAPYNQGRTLTHEVGHFLGLYHTFNGGCSNSSNCYSSGDRICDTNAESNPEYNCPNSSSSCGSQDPVRNYMNYSPDACMTGFTEEQARRIRCTLEFYRPALAQPTTIPLGENYCVFTPNSSGSSAGLTAFGTKLIANNDFSLLASSLPQDAFGYFLVSDTQVQVANPGGSQGTLCVGGNVGRYLSQIGSSGFFGELFLSVDLTAIPQPNGLISVQPGDTLNFQAWFRDANPMVTSNLTDAYTITFE